MRKSLFLSLFVLFTFSCGCFASGNSVQSKINQVTVFKSGAFVERIAMASVNSGTSTLIVNGLSPTIDPNGILVKIKNEKIKLVSVNHEFDFANREKTLNELNKVTAEADKIKDSITSINNELAILNEEWNFLSANKVIKGDDGLYVDDMEEMVKFFREKMTSIKSNQTKLEKKKKEFTQQYIDLTQMQIVLNQMSNEYTSQLQIVVNSEVEAETEIDITYFVSDAGWTPFYDIRIASLNSPLEMAYKALVHQNTMEDWEDLSEWE